MGGIGESISADTSRSLRMNPLEPEKLLGRPCAVLAIDDIAYPANRLDEQ